MKASLLNAGLFSQGDHTINVIAYAANGAASSVAVGTFTIDNTPTVTIESQGLVEGEFDANGTITFKPNPGGTEGTLKLSIDNQNFF